MNKMRVINRKNLWYVGSDNGYVLSNHYKKEFLANLALEQLNMKLNVIMFKLRYSEIQDLSENEVRRALVSLSEFHITFALKLIDAEFIKIEDILSTSSESLLH